MKHYDQGQSLNQKILEGVDILADNVATTLGPRGRNVALYHKEQNIPIITKDGVTVATLSSISTLESPNPLNFLVRWITYLTRGAACGRPTMMHLEFDGATITSNAGLLACRTKVFGKGEVARSVLTFD